MNDIRALVRRQRNLEDEATTLGANRYRQSRPMPWKMDGEPSVEEEANLPPGQQLIKMAVEPTAALLREKMDAYDTGKAGKRHSALKWLKESSLEEAAYLTTRVALNEAAVRATFQTATIRIGEALIRHVEMLLFAEKNKAGYVGLIRSNYQRTSSSRKRRAALRKLLAEEDAVVQISRKEKVHLGAFLLDTLIEATNFFSVDLVPINPKDKGYILRPTETVEEWLERSHARSELLQPMLMPMLVRPRQWTSPFRGGYLSQPAGKYLVRPSGPWTEETRTYLDTLAQQDPYEVYNAVNVIQNTAWEINADILRLMREVWDGGGRLGGLPAREDTPLPAVPEGMDEDEAKMSRWKSEAAFVHRQNGLNRAKRLTMAQRLWMAEKFADEEALWFPHSLDFRGRVYPLASGAGFSPQGNDPGKALIRFKEGKPLGPKGGYWLAVHIANLFGVDKVNFKDRVDWTMRHSRELLDSAIMPLDGERFWTQADSPWMALAAAIEFAGWMEEGEDFVSHLPIALDGSNSGLQHFSAMLRDPRGGAAVNLLPSKLPQDVYTQVAEMAQATVDADDDPDAAPWKGGKITRKIAKRPTMTFVYSATRFGMQDMILGTLRETDAENDERGKPPHLEGADNYAAARYLSHVLYAAIGEVVSAASGAMAWLREVASVASDAGVSLRWTTPDGLIVQQNYRNTLGRRVQVHWQGRQIKVTLSVKGRALDSRGQANGIAPNFVHSMDAAHLRAVAREADRAGIKSLAVIHDSFGTHAADTDRLVEVLRSTFVDQYEPDILRQFYDEVTEQLPPEWAAEVPLPPEMGSLDLSQVRHSPYLFA